MNNYDDVIGEEVIDDWDLHNLRRGEALSWLRTEPRTFAQLRAKDISWFRSLAAYTTIQAVLEKLATDRTPDVRNAVARNAETPAAVLEKLATDRDLYVREAVAWNAGTPAAVLEKLATDRTSGVRYAVAWNAETPAAVLEKLATDPDL